MTSLHPALPDAPRAPFPPARIRRTSFARVAALALACLACAATAPAALLWSETFDDLNYLDGMSSEPCGDKLSGCDCADGVSLKITTKHKRLGAAAMQARLTKCHERAELREKTRNQPAVGASRYYGFSLRPNDNFDMARWSIVAQWAQWYSGVPNWANEGAWNFLGIENGRWVFRAKWSDGTAQNVKISSTDLGPVVRGSFTDFIVMGRWNAISNGELQVWVKQPGETSYTKKFYKAGSVMLDVPKAPYFKVGIYRGDPNWSSPRSVDYMTVDEVKVGTAFNDVRL